jgi:hypothetical protein
LGDEEFKMMEPYDEGARWRRRLAGDFSRVALAVRIPQDFLHGMLADAVPDSSGDRLPSQKRYQYAQVPKVE